jgi:tetratricopeptide (TPR) repeat protein
MPELYNKPPANMSLSYTLDDLLESVKQTTLSAPELDEKILALQNACKERISREFSAPVKDWQDFKNKLAQVERAYKRSPFNENLSMAAGELYSFLNRVEQDKKDEPEYWHALGLLYELNDIFHLSEDIGTDALNVGKHIQSELHELSDEWGDGASVPPAQCRLIQEKVIYCTYRGNQLKRSGDAEGAQKLFEWLFDFTINKLKVDGVFPCWEVQANLAYNLGAVYRVLEKHDKAEEMYTLTLEYLRKKVEEIGEHDVDDYFFSVRQQAMVVGIGYGWINLTRGFLHRAENALTTARAMLAHSRDPIISPYIDLLYGTIKRCRAGSDRAMLDDAIAILERVREDFKEHNHTRYVPRACWELSLAFNEVNDIEQAEKHLDAVAAYAEQTKHPKWLTNVKILRSRISRRQDNLHKALAEAESAVENARACRSILPLMDAYITRGEAHLYIAKKTNQRESKYAVARSDFDNALRLVLEMGLADLTTGLPSNPKIAAVCGLRIAQCYALEGNETKAREHYVGWDILRSNVEHEFVRELATQVKSEIESLSKNFTISAKDEKEWDYAENVAKMRRWLLTQALRQTKNYTEAAKLIGVKRATLYQWQEASSAQPKRARINTGGNARLHKGQLREVEGQEP